MPLLVRTSAANKPGSTSNANINEKATEIALTMPKSLITGIGDNNKTMKPQIVVPAEISNDAPVVAVHISHCRPYFHPFSYFLQIFSTHVWNNQYQDLWSML